MSIFSPFKQARPMFANGHSASVLYRREGLLTGPLIYEIWASDRDDPEYPLSEDEANIELARIENLPTNRLLLTYREGEDDEQG